MAETRHLHEQLTKTWDGEPYRQVETVGERGLKQRIIHEVGKFLRIFLYLTLFCVIATYRLCLLDQFEEKYFAYGAVLRQPPCIVQDYSPRGILTTGQAAGAQAADLFHYLQIVPVYASRRGLSYSGRRG